MRTETGEGFNNGALIQQWTCGPNQDNQQWIIQGESENIVRIKSKRSGKCLDVKMGPETGEGFNNGALIQQWTCGPNQDNQQWIIQGESENIVRIMSKRSGTCLDVKMGPETREGFNNGALIQQWTCGPNQDNQQWIIQGESENIVRIKSKRSGKCLDVEMGQETGEGIHNGADIQQWTCGPNQDNQQWIIE